MVVGKQKDGQDGAEFGFKLHTVTIGFDEDGEEITSCIIEHTAGGATLSRAPKGCKNTLALDTALGIIPIEGSIASEELFKKIVEQVPFDGRPDENGKKPRDRRREKAMLAVDALIESGFLRRVEGGIALPLAPNAP